MPLAGSGLRVPGASVSGPLVSVVVTSYNYARYVGETIESILAQTYPHVELIVVDDGSSDDSPTVLRRYERFARVLLKDNGGQASAFNAGFELSSGKILMFLDSDDLLLEHAVSAVVAEFERSDLAKVHWPLWVIDSEGNRTGDVKEPELPEGDFRDILASVGPMTEATLPSAPTSGNAYSRQFLHEVMPMPENEYRISPDAYLFGLAPAFGRIACLTAPSGLWRYHGSNASSTSTFEQKVANGVADHARQVEVLVRHYAKCGRPIEPDSWRRHAWWPRIADSLNELIGLTEEGERFVLADLDRWGAGPILRGRHRLHFIERDGTFWSSPDDDAASTAALARLPDDVRLFALAWPAFWWLDYYTEFARALGLWERVLANDRLIVFRR